MGKGGGKGGDAVDEEEIIVCCACCCANCGLYNACDCAGCSGKIGLCCFNVAMCLKCGTPPLPCCCCGPTIECDGCSVCNIQCQLFSLVVSGAVPCNKEVPLIVTVAGYTMYPICGCCKSVRAIKMGRS